MSNTDAFIEALEQSFELTDADFEAVVVAFHGEMERGLCGTESSLKMLPTFIDKACGRERGQFIALDLGGTNFRVLQVELSGYGKARIQQVGRYAIPEAVRHGTGAELFGFIARSIQRFFNDNAIGLGSSQTLGFTFSFPIDQSDIASGTLINWTKGFTAAGVEGVDVVMLLASALQQSGVDNINIAALVNDTVGALAARSYQDPDCDVGIIFGTGTNACYREKVSNIKKLKPVPVGSEHMIVNIEWGNFSPRRVTDYDRRLDQSTSEPGKQRMEKMISGLYLGEITRLILERGIREYGWFGNGNTRLTKENFRTQHMSLVESDQSHGLLKIQDYLETLGLSDTSYDDRAAVLKICRIVSTRAARLSAAAISAIVTWMDPELANKHTLAIDGALYEKYPQFGQRIIDALADRHGDASKKIRLTGVKDGSGIGVAVAAAVATYSR